MLAIINYGLGNIKALTNVYKNLNIPFKIALSSDDLKNTSSLILPGVGAFDYAMRLLEQSGMRKSLNNLVLQHNIPILGICVGMQMLANSSEEGILPGLGWIDGIVKKFDSATLIHKPKFPHMGWNNVNSIKNSKLFQNIETGSRFYFIHSYYFQCHHNKDIIATTDYGIQFTSAVNTRNIYGVQFHPEKSHQNGIQLLKNFGNI